MNRESTLVRIWSGEHQAYWRPGGHGYTRRASEAGVFDRADAARRTSHCGPEKMIELDPIPEATCPIDAAATIESLTAELAQAREQIAGLREVLGMVDQAMLRGGDGAVGDFGWNITKLNKARQPIRAILSATAAPDERQRDD